MKIDLVFSSEDGDELSGVLGNIVIQKDSVKISEDCVYIESWLEVLIDGLSLCQRNEDYIGDLVEEPDSLFFFRDKSRIRLKFKTQEIVLENCEELKMALVRASTLFIEHLKCDLQKLRESPIFKKIFDFVEFSKNGKPLPKIS
jgi:hypothetical protein